MRKIKNSILLCFFLSNGIAYSQNEFHIDSIKINYIPFNVRGEFLYSIDEFKISDNLFKKTIVLDDLEKINSIYNKLSTNNQIFNKNTISNWVLFEFYKDGKILETITMDCYGRVKFHINSQNCIYDLELNSFFKKLTNQENVKCSSN